MNVVLVKSKQFAVRIIRLCSYLQDEKHEYVLSKQLLRSGTSIGANVREGTQAASKADFINKLSIALKESVETEYWLELLYETDYLTQKEFQSIYKDNEERKNLNYIPAGDTFIINYPLSIINSFMRSEKFGPT